MKKSISILMILGIMLAMLLIGCSKGESTDNSKDDSIKVAEKAFNALKDKDYKKYYSYFSDESINVVKETRESLAERLKADQEEKGIDITSVKVVNSKDFKEGIKIVSYEVAYNDKTGQGRLERNQVALRKEGKDYKILYEGIIQGKDFEENNTVLGTDKYRITLIKDLETVAGKQIYFHLENNTNRELNFGTKENSKFILTTDRGTYESQFKRSFGAQENTTVNAFFKEASGDIHKIEVNGLYVGSDEINFVLYEKK